MVKFKKNLYYFVIVTYWSKISCLCNLKKKKFRVKIYIIILDDTSVNCDGFYTQIYLILVRSNKNTILNKNKKKKTDKKKFLSVFKERIFDEKVNEKIIVTFMNQVNMYKFWYASYSVRYCILR